MLDGLYQSVVCFFLPYLLFSPATFNTESGRGVNDNKRIGVYIANATIVVVNTYILMNTYRWDWFMVLITVISVVLIWLWTGAYTSFTDGFTFYGAAAQCYGELSFWALTLLTVIVALLPRFAIKSFQKIFMPRDVDIIREQLRQGKFDYLKNVDPTDSSGVTPPVQKMSDSTSGSDISKPSNLRKLSTNPINDDERPIYPPSIAATATTRNPRSHNGSDGTDYTGHRSSIERSFPAVAQVTSGDYDNGYGNGHGHGQNNPSYMVSPPEGPEYEGEVHRPSFDDRPRPSFDRMRQSMEFERTRPSFEQSRDFTSAAYLGRVESSQSGTQSKRRDEIGHAF